MEIGARRVSAVAAHLAQSGCRVVVVSAFGGKPLKRGAEVLPGVFALPISMPSRAFLDGAVAFKRMLWGRSRGSVDLAPLASGTSLIRGSTIARVRGAYFRSLYFIDGYKRWAWRASRAAIRAGAQDPTCVVLASGPPHSVLVAGALAARRLRVPFVADLRDPWADDVDGASSSGSGLSKWLRRLERAVLGSASAVTFTGAAAADLIESRYANLKHKVHVIRNGYDGNVHQRASETRSRLSILFAGELYVGRDPFPFLRALEWLLNQPGVDSSRVHVTFMGKADTYGGKRLSDALRGTRSADVVNIIAPQSPAAVACAVEESTVVLNLAQGQRLSVPAKTFEHLASGRENLLLCEDDCETARLVEGIAGVNQVDPSDFQRLTATLLSLYNRHVLIGEMTAPGKMQVGRFSREASNDAFLKLLQSLSPSLAAKGADAGSLRLDLES